MSIVVEPPGGAVCRSCGRKKRRDENFSGPLMWFEMWPGCDHEKFFLCWDCYGSDYLATCSICGCEEFNT